MDNEERDEESGEDGGEDNGFLDPPKVNPNGAGAAPAAEPQQASTPKRGGRPKGSRNRTTLEREQAQATGVGAPTVRPAGKTGHFPGEEGKIPNEADLLWPYIIEEIQENNYSPYDMEIRVERKTPLPAIPMLTFDASSVMGDQVTSPATALRQFIENWIHLPSGVMGPALYVVHFCWKNRAQFFRRGEIQVGSRNEILAMQQATQARQSQSGAAGVGAPYIPPPQQHVPQQPQQPWPQPAYPYAQPPQQQPTFDAEAERARIRHELEREFEITSMRRELDELRRRPAPPPLYGGFPYPAAAHANPPPRGRGVGAPQYPSAPPQYPPAPPYESEDERTARVVVAVLHQMGIGPQRPQQQGVGASPVLQTAVQQSTGAVDDLERAFDTLARGKKLARRVREIFDEDGEEKTAKKQGVGATPEESEEAVPKIRFQGTGQRWKDGREVMMPIDQDGEPILPTTIPAALATGFANPFLLEPIAQGVGQVMSRVSSMMTGLGAQPQQPQRTDIHVQQVPQQPVGSAPPPVPYYPPQQMQQPPPQQTPAVLAPTSDGDWNLT